MIINSGKDPARWLYATSDSQVSGGSDSRIPCGLHRTVGTQLGVVALLMSDGGPTRRTVKLRRDSSMPEHDELFKRSRSEQAALAMRLLTLRCDGSRETADVTSALSRYKYSLWFWRDDTFQVSATDGD